MSLNLIQQWRDTPSGPLKTFGASCGVAAALAIAAQFYVMSEISNAVDARRAAEAVKPAAGEAMHPSASGPK